MSRQSCERLRIPQEELDNAAEQSDDWSLDLTRIICRKCMNGWMDRTNLFMCFISSIQSGLTCFKLIGLNSKLTM